MTFCRVTPRSSSNQQNPLSHNAENLALMLQNEQSTFQLCAVYMV